MRACKSVRVRACVQERACKSVCAWVWGRGILRQDNSRHANIQGSGVSGRKCVNRQEIELLHFMVPPLEPSNELVAQAVQSLRARRAQINVLQNISHNSLGGDRKNLQRCEILLGGCNQKFRECSEKPYSV